MQPASGRGAERTEERAITYAEMALLNRRELDSSVGVGVWREGDNAARESRNPRERRMRLTGTDEERERGLLQVQFRSLAAAVARPLKTIRTQHGFLAVSLNLRDSEKSTVQTVKMGKVYKIPKYNDCN